MVGATGSQRFLLLESGKKWHNLTVRQVTVRDHRVKIRSQSDPWGVSFPHG
jgi:hypothetical protein